MNYAEFCIFVCFVLVRVGAVLTLFEKNAFREICEENNILQNIS